MGRFLFLYVLEENPLKRKILAIALVICLCCSLIVQVSASEMGQLESYGVSLIQYYLHHQEAADDVIWDITRQMKEIDRKQGAIWEKIMFDWSWINSDMPVYEDILPDGLAQDSSLCIVVMGFGLNEDGSIRPELENRLNVALRSALKYPNASILVTGGQTGAVEGVTEAGQMAAWLQRNGISDSRIIQEKQSLSTTANAVNCYKLLTKAYPQVSSIAVITSDYHITESCAMFAVVSNYQSGYKGGKSLELVANAVCDTGTEYDSLTTQAWGMSLVLGIPYDNNAKAPALYYVERTEEPAYEETTEPQEEPQPVVRMEPVQPEEIPGAPDRMNLKLLAAIAVGSLVIVVWMISPKRPSKKNRRERPKMNWDE